MPEQSFLFKPPGAEALAITANRLLKFEFPAWRNTSAYQRLITQQVHSPKPSRKTLDALPLTMLESFCATLWEHSVWDRGVSGDPDCNDTRNILLNLLVLAIEMVEFKPEALVRSDIEILGHTDSGDYTTQLHSYYFKGQTDRNTLRTILEQHQCRVDFMDAATDTQILSSYLACRKLTHPFAWADLLDLLAKQKWDWAAYPALQELLRHHRALESSGYYEQLSSEAGGLTPENLPTWLDKLSGYLLQTGARPVREVVMVEGETERRLLPLFARSAGMDFEALGVFLLPAGGKNKVPGLYDRLASVLNIPMFVLLDTDADTAAETVKKNLRTGDAVYVLEEGEFEDTYDPSLVIKTINRHYQPYPLLTEQSLQALMLENNHTGRVDLLKSLWVNRGWGQFDKTDFALKMAEALNEQTGLPSQSIRKLLNAIMAIHPRSLHKHNIHTTQV